MKEKYDFEEDMRKWEKKQWKDFIRYLEEILKKCGWKGIIILFSDVFALICSLAIIIDVSFRSTIDLSSKYLWIPFILMLFFLYLRKNREKILSKIAQRRRG